ncbi:MAG: UDP-N-acetylmuramoyl-tripeptide--D-alanyl-D-alanine ligase [Ardenticatenia bacterium]|nr:UDP-N-acetylmuramoyl-tripeptide--D-alanyl-D-alanine ligase [Ardenticatenia bacterium]
MPTLADLFTGLTGHPAPSGHAHRLQIAGFVADSRLVEPGYAFVAVPGEQTDGHRFIGEALRRGATVVIASRDAVPADVYTGITVVDVCSPYQVGELTPPVLFLTDESVQAVQELAAWWRRRANPALRVVGITGSVGKTTVKELTAAVLGQRFRTFKSRGNYNSDIGLPLTLLTMPLDAERAVLEMAMTARGEIARLAEIARPVVGVVTNVAPVHMERLGTIEAIAAAKAELIEALPQNGVAVLNGDDRRVRAMASLARCHVFTYGLHPDNALWASHIESHGLDGIAFRFHYGQETIFARLPLLGRHSVHSALAAASVGLIEGQSWAEIIAGLKALEKMELLRIIVVPGINGTTIIDDTYNASPPSVLAALNLLNDLNGRKVAVLGDMLELGAYEEEGHKRVARRAAEVVDLLVTVGPRGRLIAAEALASGMAPEHVVATDTPEKAIAFLKTNLQPGDMVLVKASRAVRLDRVVSALSADVE